MLTLLNKLCGKHVNEGGRVSKIFKILSTLFLNGLWRIRSNLIHLKKQIYGRGSRHFSHQESTKSNPKKRFSAFWKLIYLLHIFLIKTYSNHPHSTRHRCSKKLFSASPLHPFYTSLVQWFLNFFMKQWSIPYVGVFGGVLWVMLSVF